MLPIIAWDAAGLLAVAAICWWSERPRPLDDLRTLPNTLRLAFARRPRPEPRGMPPSAAPIPTAPWSVVPQTEG